MSDASSSFPRTLDPSAREAWANDDTVTAEERLTRRLFLTVMEAEREQLKVIDETAEHIARDFGLTIIPDFRADHDATTGEFTETVTAAELMAEFDATAERANRRFESNDGFAIPGLVTVLNQDGQDLYARITVTDREIQRRAILTAIAEAIALDKHARDARERAETLIAVFNNPGAFDLDEATRA